ncbi:amino acid permease [Ottowia sp. GY511]|uniref:APC family permease n=1 Tax=Ottowia flava TaxID=2675430 RepID=A0ABW4KXU4_9BURK|nr:amino acid permease [Ottowia sp. GY511]TXK26238.1 amino acid permease [Ottowia sp. GY511]
MTAPASETLQPQPSLRLHEAVAIIVGIVIGAGIFKAPSLVAQFTDSVAWMIGAWVLGGLVSLVGALCYAELAAAWPHVGGDYHFLHRAYGKRMAFLFAWARFSVITTGSIALLAFVFGDYVNALVPLGEYGAAFWGTLAVMLLTWLNARGIHTSAGTQTWLTLAEVLGLVLVVVAGAWLWLDTGHAMPGVTGSVPAESGASGGMPGLGMLGLAMVFVLLTYGGWNEAAYLSAELRGSRRGMLHALTISLGLITLLYVLVNLAYVYGLGLQGMAQSEAVAADLLRVAFGRTGETLIAIMVAVAALTSINATMIVGARTSFAVGRDWRGLHALGRWEGERGVPVVALYVQSALALLLVAFGASLRGGFQAMVDYTAPVFWFFFLLCTVALIVLRIKEPDTVRPFRVPLYPLLPLLFAAVCGYMLWSSLVYVKAGAMAGVAVLAVGFVLAWALERQGEGAEEARTEC